MMMGQNGDADDTIKKELARELHDQVVQDLTAMLIDLENFKRRPFDSQSTVSQVDFVQGSLRTMLGRLRGMLYGLRDEEAWESDFAETLRIFAVQQTNRTGTKVLIHVDPDWPDPIRRSAAQHLARIVNEAVTNALHHGGAGSVRVSLRVGEGLAQLAVQDDGKGLPTTDDGLARPGMGMLGMRERALLLGGHLSIESAPGEGTGIGVNFPRTVLDGPLEAEPLAVASSPQPP